MNFLGDRSAKAMQQAHGLMVNYLYKLDDIVANHEAMAQRGEVIASAAVKASLNQNDESRRSGHGQQGAGPFAQINEFDAWRRAKVSNYLFDAVRAAAPADALFIPDRWRKLLDL